MPTGKETDASNGARQRLLSLEAGRFFAATAVMLYHLSRQIGESGTPIFGDAFSALRMGVPYFFVLSGFVIYHVHRDDLGRPARLTRFMQRRAVRLLPMFWAISLPMLVAFLIVPSLAGERLITPVGTIFDLALLPHGDAILAISWTLRHEVVFYAIFGLAILLGPHLLWLVAIWAIIGLLLPGASASQLGAWSILASSYNLGFFLGLACGLALRSRAAFRPGLIAMLGAGIMILIFLLDWTMSNGPKDDPLGLTGSLAHLVAAALLIYGLVGIEARWQMPGATVWKALGGSSYTLYLVHQPLSSLLERILHRIGGLSGEARFVILAMISLVAALALHLLFEQPLLKRLNRWMAGRTSAT